MGIPSEKATLLFCLPSQQGSTLKVKEFAPPSRSKFFPLRVDPMSKSYIIQRSKQEFVIVYVSLFSEKRQAGRAGGGGGGDAHYSTGIF